MAFRVGQEVVCIDDADYGYGNPISLRFLKRGRVYTIASAPFINRWGNEAYHIAELPNDCGYKKSRFRPIVKTDISIFTAMLAPSPKKRVDADA